MLTDIVAEREAVAILANGERKMLRLAVGKPYKCGEAEWACPVEIKGLYDIASDVRGNDSWQALGLAIALMQKLLTCFP